jgi:hypothetical protein
VTLKKKSSKKSTATPTKSGRGGKRENAGRKPGSKNKTTKAEQYRKMYIDLRGHIGKLGITILEDAAQLFAGLMIKAAKAAETEKDAVRQAAALDDLMKFADMTHRFAASAAPYQSPKFNPIDSPHVPKDDEGKGETYIIDVSIRNARGQIESRIIDGKVQELPAPEAFEVERRDFEG